MIMKKQNIIAAVFLVAEAVLYWLILTTGGQTLITCQYLSIILCFAFAALTCNKGTLLILAGLAFTLGADYCLVVAKPIQQLWGMVFFMGTQTMYAIYLQTNSRNRILLIVRIALVVLAEGIAWIVLGDQLDPLAAVSMYYYANLIMNLVEAFGMFRKEKLLSIGFISGSQSGDDGNISVVSGFYEIQFARDQVYCINDIVEGSREKLFTTIRFISFGDGMKQAGRGDVFQAERGGLRLFHSYGGMKCDRLAVDIADRDFIPVNTCKFADSGAAQSLRAPTSNTAQAEHGHMALRQAFHGCFAQQHLSSAELFCHKVGLPGLKRGALLKQRTLFCDLN